MSRSEETRRRLQHHAIRLFTARGFDAVTVDEIAAAAGVSHMTFFRHFPTKESVVLDDPYDPVIGRAVASQDPELPALERVRRGLLWAWEHVEEPDDGETRDRIRLAAAHDSIRARVWHNNRATEDIIAAALRDTGAPRLDAAIAAGAVLGALTAALFDWAEHDGGGTLGDRVRRALGALGPGTGTP